MHGMTGPNEVLRTKGVRSKQIFMQGCIMGTGPVELPKAHP